MHESTDDRVLYLGIIGAQTVFRRGQRKLKLTTTVNISERDVSSVGCEYN